MKGHLLSPPHNYPALKQESAIDWPSPGLGGRLKGQWEGLNLRPGLEDIEIESVLVVNKKTSFIVQGRESEGEARCLQESLQENLNCYCSICSTYFPAGPVALIPPTQTKTHLFLLPFTSSHFYQFYVFGIATVLPLYIYHFCFLHGNHSFHKNIMATRVISDVCQDA